MLLQSHRRQWAWSYPSETPPHTGAPHKQNWHGTPSHADGRQQCSRHAPRRHPHARRPITVDPSGTRAPPSPIPHRTANTPPSSLICDEHKAPGLGQWTATAKRRAPPAPRRPSQPVPLRTPIRRRHGKSEKCDPRRRRQLPTATATGNGDDAMSPSRPVATQTVPPAVASTAPQSVPWSAAMSASPRTAMSPPVTVKSSLPNAVRRLTATVAVDSRDAGSTTSAEMVSA